jgi:hypothetical protein
VLFDSQFLVLVGTGELENEALELLDLRLVRGHDRNREHVQYSVETTGVSEVDADEAIRFDHDVVRLSVYLAVRAQDCCIDGMARDSGTECIGLVFHGMRLLEGAEQQCVDLVT